MPHCHDHSPSPQYRHILWAALIINALMFAVELASGFKANSLALLADSLDFVSDAVNYGLTLAVLWAAPHRRSRAAQIKALCMLGFGFFSIGKTVWNLAHNAPVEAFTMGVVGTLALVANLSVAALLYAYRDGDANQQSAWLCSRNDVIGNLAVLAAAVGVGTSGSAWPDLAVATIMASLAIGSGWRILKMAKQELTN